MSHVHQRWLKFTALLLVPLLLYAVLAERASWRPRIFHYGDNVTAVAYSANGQWLACARQSKLELRDAQTAQVVWQNELAEDYIKAMAFAPDSQTLVISRNNSLQLWDVLTHTLRYDLMAHYPYWHNATALFFTPDSAHLITGGDESQVLLWDTQSGKLIRTVSNAKTVVPVALSADARTLALITYRSVATYVTLCNVATGQPLGALRPAAEDETSCAAFAPDHKTLAMGTGGGQILLWDITTGHEMRQFMAHPNGVNHLAFSLNGQLLATSGADDTVKLWDAQQGKLLRTLTQHKGSINGLSFAPDGATLAVACGQTVQLWRVK